MELKTEILIIGGGASGMIQGSLFASREQIEEYFHGKIG